MLNTPNIRFKGFTEPWEQRKLGEVGFAKSGVGFPDSEQGGTEGIPFFKVSDMNMEGNENELVQANNYVTIEQISKKKWNVIDDVPAIFFAKVGAAVMLNRKRLVYSPFLLDNNTMAYIFDKNIWDCNFAKTLFETVDLTKLTQVGALPSYNSSDVEDVKIALPNKAEQERIGSYFSNLDHLITFHQRKCDEMSKLKRFMLKKMFPQNGEQFPEIRFSGFSEPWERRKLGEVAGRIYGGGTPKTSIEEYWDGNIPWIQSSNLSEHELFRIDIQKYITKLGLQKSAAQLVPKNSIAVVSHVGVGKLVFMPFDYTTSQDFISLSELSSNIIFTCYAIYKRLQEDLHIVQGSAIKGITKDDLLNKEVMFPGLPEQEKLGNALQNLDHLVTLHQRKCEEFKEIKKYMLQNMFPQKG